MVNLKVVNSTPLKACQFCHCVPELLNSKEVFTNAIINSPIMYGVFCNCRQWWETQQEAIEDWNKRA